MHRMLRIALVAAAAAFSPITHAAQITPSRFYAGVSVGPSFETGYNPNAAFKVSAGYEILKYLAVEGEAGFLGKLRATLAPGQTMTDESYAAAVMAVGRLPIDEHNVVYGKVGMGIFHDITTIRDSAGSIYCPGCTTDFYTSSSNTDWGPVLGAGYQHRFATRNGRAAWLPDALRVEAQAYSNDVDILDVGVIYNF